MTRSRSLLWLVLATTVCYAGSADAGVRGKRFVGGFVTNFGLPAVCTLEFDTQGQLTLWEYGVLFGGTYVGPYTEQGPPRATSWLSFMPDESPNGTATLSGFCPAGILTTYHNENLDQLIRCDGLLFYAGTVP